MIYCPSDTCDLLNGDQINRNQIDNFAIRYRYFLKEKEKKTREGIVKEKGKFKISAINLGASQNLINPLLKRQADQIRHLSRNEHYKLYCCEGQIDWRMIVGIGGEHVQETNMTLDHVYGIPIIPGSAIKGIVRSWKIQNDFNDDEKLALSNLEDERVRARLDEDLITKIREFQKVFGTQDQIGGVRFLRAYPVDRAPLHTDIMNPHFPDYYGGSSLPTDDQSPVPINFLTIQNTKFRFVILSKDQPLLDLAKDWLINAVKDHGIGAKTAVGYGYFRRPQNRNIGNNFDPFDLVEREIKPPIETDLDLESIKKCLGKFATIAKEEICEIDDLGGVDDIPPDLIEVADELVALSEKGNEIWEKHGDELLKS